MYFNFEFALKTVLVESAVFVYANKQGYADEIWLYKTEIGTKLID